MFVWSAGEHEFRVLFWSVAYFKIVFFIPPVKSFRAEQLSGLLKFSTPLTISDSFVTIETC